MAVDFRVRPPYGEGKNQVLFKGLMPPDNRLDEAPLMIGRRRVASAIAGSVDQMVQEMDIAGIDVGVLMGRKTNNPVYGNADTNELFELSEKFPGRFVVFAGIHPEEKDWREQLESAAARGPRASLLTVAGGRTRCAATTPCLCPSTRPARKGPHRPVTSSIYLGKDVSYSNPAAIQRISVPRLSRLAIVLALTSSKVSLATSFRAIMGGRLSESSPTIGFSWVVIGHPPRGVTCVHPVRGDDEK